MGSGTYSSMTQPFTMPHSASNMSAVSSIRQDPMGMYLFTSSEMIKNAFPFSFENEMANKMAALIKS